MKKKDMFTWVECQAVIGLINANIEEGSYFGNREQYYNRLERIKQKIDKLTN